MIWHDGDHRNCTVVLFYQILIVFSLPEMKSNYLAFAFLAYFKILFFIIRFPALFLSEFGRLSEAPEKSTNLR